ncbi:MAG: GGDEF domain-containing protein [Betaproteobacteria bacterium]
MRRWSAWGWTGSWCWMSADPVHGRSGQLGKQLLFYRAAFWVGLGTAAIAIAGALWFDRKFDDIRASAQAQTAGMLANGLANALKNELILRDFAGLEARLQQSMANEALLSALIIDAKGQVLSQVRRAKAGEPSIPVFDTPRIDWPMPSQMLERRGSVLVQWVPVESGIPLGWLRLELGNTRAGDDLHQLQNQTTLIAALTTVVLGLLLLIVLRRMYALMLARESALQQAHDALESVAYHDALTQLPNRRLLTEQLRLAVANSDRHGHRLAVCFLDLDGFKQVNDNYGHDAGDDVLCQLARRLEDVIRANESVARLGGDEFVVLLTNFGDLTHCEDILQRLLTEVARPLQIGPHSVQIQASIGVALYPSPGGRSDALLDQADQAMYRAKQAGKNCWRFYEP